LNPVCKRPFNYSKPATEKLSRFSAFPAIVFNPSLTAEQNSEVVKDEEFTKKE